MDAEVKIPDFIVKIEARVEPPKESQECQQPKEPAKPKPSA